MLPHPIISGLALAFAAQAPTADVLDLRTAVRQALQANPEVAEAEATADAERAAVGVAKAWPEPVFSYLAWEQPLDKPFDPTATTMHMLGVRQTIPFPGQRGRAGRVAEVGAAAQKAELAAVQLGLEAQVAHALVAYWLAKKELAAHVRHHQLAQQTLDSIKARFLTGEARQADILRAEAELQRLHSTISGLHEEIEGSQAYLNSVMGRDPDAPLGEPGEPETTLPGPQKDRPEVVAAKLREEQAKEGAALAARDKHLPEVMVGFDYMLTPSMPDAFAVMVQVPIPWAWGRRASEAERAQHKLRAAQAAKRGAENAARFAVAEAQARAASAKAQMQVLEQQALPSSERALEATRSNYAAGQADAVELLSAETALIDTQLLLLRQRAALANAIADLRRARGLSVLEENQP